MSSFTVLDVLASLEAFGAIDLGPLRLDFLRMKPGATHEPPDYLTLEEGLGTGRVSLSEVNDGGVVPSLRLVNGSGQPVFLLGGELVRGGKQDRMVNTDVLVAAGADIRVPVSCVERGRWRYATKRFSSGGTGSPTVRASLSRSVSRSYRSSGRPTSDQKAIWHSVDSIGDSLGSHSPTSSLSDHYDGRRAEILDVSGGVYAPEDAAGVLARFNDGRTALDHFDRPRTLHQYFHRLLEAYAAEALGNSRSRVLPPAPVADWSVLCAGAQLSEHASIGLGQEVRLSSDRVAGAALVAEGSLIHLSLVVT